MFNGQLPDRQRLYEIMEVAARGDLSSKITDICLGSLVLLSVVAVVLESIDALHARLFKLTRYSEAITSLLQVLRDNVRSFAAALMILMIVMLLAASGIYLFEREAQPVAFGSIPAAMWWAFATLTTVGYGDVTPVTVGGKVFGAVITVVGVGMVALPAGILASAFSQHLRIKEEDYRDMADQAYEDGVLSEEELSSLERNRMELGLSEEMASRILAEEEFRLGHHHDALAPRCPHYGGDLTTTEQARAPRQRVAGLD